MASNRSTKAKRASASQPTELRKQTPAQESRESSSEAPPPASAGIAEAESRSAQRLALEQAMAR